MSNRSRYNRQGTRGWQALGILLVVGYVVVQFVIFQVSLSRLPASWTIGGQAFPDQTIDEAMTQLETDLQEPVTLHYLTSTVELEPTAIDFTFDNGKAGAGCALAKATVSDFLRHLSRPRRRVTLRWFSDESTRLPSR
jgi:hypothetical protein